MNDGLIDSELATALKCKHLKKGNDGYVFECYVCEKSGKIASKVSCLLCEEREQ